MRRIIYPAILSLIVVAGLFIGMVKGQETRHRWIAKMKNRHADHEKGGSELVMDIHDSEVTLDEIEMATYHS